METKSIVLWVVIGVLVIAVLYTSLGAGNVATTTQVAGQAVSSSGGMVGGC